MSKIYFKLTVDEDGSMTIPAFVARGLGCRPGDEVMGASPSGSACDAGCECAELYIGPCCTEGECSGYTSDGDEVNLPAPMLAEAGIPMGAELSVIAGDKTLVLAMGDEELSDLPCEIEELLAELGVQPGMRKVVPLRGGTFNG